MSIFTKALKYSKPSRQIDAKIDLLNCELKKTKLGEAIANSTSGVYSITQDIDAVLAVPPTNTEVPDVSGITGEGFNQPTGGGIENDLNTWEYGWNNNDYLKNPNEIGGESNRPIIATVPNSPYHNAGYGGIVTYSGYFGTSVGYITAGNEYRQILIGDILGGTENPDAPNARSPGQGGYYGGLTDSQYDYAVQFWRKYQSIVNLAGSKSLRVWNTYNRFHDFQRGGEFATWTGGPKRSDGKILVNVNILVAPQTYESDPGSPYERGYTTLIYRNGLGDPNYYPGTVQPQGDIAGFGPHEIDAALMIIKGTPGTPDAQRARDALDRWATPGSKNREILIRMGILERASSDIGGNAQIAGYNQSGNAGYGNPNNIQWNKGGKPGPGYKEPDPKTPVKGAQLSTDQDTQIAATYGGAAAERQQKIDAFMKTVPSGNQFGRRFDPLGRELDPKTGKLKGA